MKRRQDDGAIVAVQASCPDDPATGVAVLTLLARRAEDASVCPSEVARAVAREAGLPDWRGAMTDVHAAVDQLNDAGLIRLSWQGRPLDVRSGPYRIRRPVT